MEWNQILNDSLYPFDKHWNKKNLLPKDLVKCKDSNNFSKLRQGICGAKSHSSIT